MSDIEVTGIVETEQEITGYIQHDIDITGTVETEQEIVGQLHHDLEVVANVSLSGPAGKDIEYTVDGGMLGIRRNGETEYNWINLQQDSRHTHYQLQPSAEWVIDHPLNGYPSITIVDSSGNIVEGDKRYESTSRIIATFSAAFAGKAHLN